MVGNDLTTRQIERYRRKNIRQAKKEKRKGENGSGQLSPAGMFAARYGRQNLSALDVFLAKARSQKRKNSGDGTGGPADNFGKMINGYFTERDELKNKIVGNYRTKALLRKN